MRRPPRRRAPRRSATARTVGALAVLGVLVGGLAGCGSDDPREGCGWMETQTSTPDADSTVILVDGSKSVRGAASGTQGLDYGRVVGDLLDKEDEKGGVISIGTFGGPAGQVEWTVERRPADWRRSNPNPDNQEQNRQDANRCLKDDITEAQQKAPADGGTDVLAALAAGADMFEGVQGVRRLLVLSDGLATTGCADLRSARFGSPQELDSIVSVCAAPGKFGELPDLRGAEVTFMGLGRSAGGQPAANSAQRAWLGELWKALCERAGPPADPAPAATRPSARRRSPTGPRPVPCRTTRWCRTATARPGRTRCPARPCSTATRHRCSPRPCPCSPLSPRPHERPLRSSVSWSTGTSIRAVAPATTSRSPRPARTRWRRCSSTTGCPSRGWRRTAGACHRAAPRPRPRNPCPGSSGCSAIAE
ncbi:vWA domain-containing protein [Streptomyces sp. MS1.HAVA.3]|uniref:VWA domain-containing protein n=1 Tax=Streptomyces caledonius TaxID=3134107 RepID=A0ABU8UEI9_9ACTN